VLTKRDSKPIVIASANGNLSKDAAGLTCVAKAFQMIRPLSAQDCTWTDECRVGVGGNAWQQDKGNTPVFSAVRSAQPQKGALTPEIVRAPPLSLGLN
jgi:hypothetical protein